MPRIPIRLEPYNSPSKQHRHFKSKRDQVLRALGKAAYINGSQFALLLVSARGDVETFASESLQGRLDDWFVKSGIADEARNIAVARQDDAAGSSFSADDVMQDQTNELMETPGSTSSMKLADDPFLDSWNPRPMDTPRSLATQPSWPTLPKHDSMTEDIQNPLENTSNMDMASPHIAGSVPRASTPVRASVPRRSSQLSSRVASHALQAPHTIELKDEAARTAFLEMRFSQMQQVMCKMVAKEWIKVIEPKKQTRYPYMKGEEARPAWWPAGVRHKEPDHLMKPERQALLLAILRSPQAQIARLQLATAEVAALIKAGKSSYLMDIYRVARAEEKLRLENKDINTPVMVGVSSLEGCEGAESETSPVPGTTAKDAKGKQRAAGRLMDTDAEPRAVWDTPTDRRHGHPPGMPLGAGQRPPMMPAALHEPPAGARLRSFDVGPVSRSMSVSGQSSYEPSPDLFSPALPSPRTGAVSMDANATPLSVSHSPAMTGSPLAMPTLGPPSHPPEHRALSFSQGHPAAAVAMRPTRSTPSHIPNTPDHWAGRHRLHPPAPAPMAWDGTPGPSPLPPTDDGRMAWNLGHADASQPPAMVLSERSPEGNVSAQWPMPETPGARASQSQSSMMGFPVGMTPYGGDVRLASSFDSSFSSHHGPATPASLPPASMGGNAPVAMAPPNQGWALGFHVPSAPPTVSAVDMAPLATKPPSDPPFPPMGEWS